MSIKQPKPWQYFRYVVDGEIFRCLFIDDITILFESKEGDRSLDSGAQDFILATQDEAKAEGFNVNDDPPAEVGPLWPITGDLFIYQHTVYRLNSRVGNDVTFETAAGNRFFGTLLNMGIRPATKDDVANFYAQG